MTRLHALLLCLTFVPACGGSDDEPGSNGAALTCAEDEFKLAGTLDGEAVSHQGALGGHAWIQGSKPSTLDASFEGGGSVHTEWPDVIARGATTAVAGSITLPPDGPRASETLAAGSGTMTALEDGASFELTSFTIQVQCINPPCPAEPVEGTLEGCVHFPSF